MFLFTLFNFWTWTALQENQPELYIPVYRNIEGWNVSIDPMLFHEPNLNIYQKAQTALANHLQRVKFILPLERIRELQQLPIRLEWDNPRLTTMQYHPDQSWLITHGHDPSLAKHVHIPQAASLYDPHMWAKHPYVILHELAHAYHDQFLRFDHPEILAVYRAAKLRGDYEKVLLYTGTTVRHYGLTDHKEYFAEATEAYWGVNDFYPFVRAELKEHDPAMYQLLEKIWGPVP